MASAPVMAQPSFFAARRARMDDYLCGLQRWLNDRLAEHLQGLDGALRSGWILPFPEVSCLVRGYVGETVPPELAAALVERIWPGVGAEGRLDLLSRVLWRRYPALISRSVHPVPSWTLVGDLSIFDLVDNLARVELRATEDTDNVLVQLWRTAAAPIAPIASQPGDAAAAPARARAMGPEVRGETTLAGLGFTLAPEPASPPDRPLSRFPRCRCDVAWRNEWFSPFDDAPRYHLEITLLSAK
jgi:hypothetical protein